MAIIPWDPAMETGDEAVDAQHMALVALFNDLVSAEHTGDERAVLSALEQLTEYVLIHFSAEEELFLNHEYPAEQAQAHRAEHQALTERTRVLVIDYRRGGFDSVVPIVEFLREWLAHHIQESDRLLVDHMRRKAS